MFISVQSKQKICLDNGFFARETTVRDITTKSNTAWLVNHHYRYLVVIQDRNRQFDTEQSIGVINKKN